MLRTVRRKERMDGLILSEFGVLLGAGFPLTILSGELSLPIV